MQRSLASSAPCGCERNTARRAHVPNAYEFSVSVRSGEVVMRPVRRITHRPRAFRSRFTEKTRSLRVAWIAPFARAQSYGDQRSDRRDRTRDFTRLSSAVVQRPGTGASFSPQAMVARAKRPSSPWSLPARTCGILALSMAMLGSCRSRDETVAHAAPPPVLRAPAKESARAKERCAPARGRG